MFNMNNIKRFFFITLLCCTLLAVKFIWTEPFQLKFESIYTKHTLVDNATVHSNVQSDMTTKNLMVTRVSNLQINTPKEVNYSTVRIFTDTSQGLTFDDMALSISKIHVTLPDLDSSYMKMIVEKYDKQFDNSGITSSNAEGVSYNKGKFEGTPTGRTILCKLKTAVPDLLSRDTQPYKEMGIAQYVPENSLYEKDHFHRCAVILSSRVLKNSNLGDEIDSHDAILRFNDAPVYGYEKDVGKKTTLRVLNSVCLAKRCNITKHDIFRNITLVIWRTGLYNGNLYRWYSQEPGKEMFAKYIAWRTAFPDQDFHIIHPKSLWDAWDIVEYFNKGNELKKKKVPTATLR